MFHGRYAIFGICVFSLLNILNTPTNGGGIVPDLPEYCTKSSMVIICTAADKGTLKQLAGILLMEVLVDFVFFDTSDKKCSCAMVELVKSVRETDVVVLTNSTCGLAEYTDCGEQVPKESSFTVAGLAISPSDAKMKWAIKHHVLDLWNKAKVLKRVWQRINIFRAILKDVSLSVVQLGDNAAKTGANQLIFGDIPPVLTVEPTPPEVRPLNLNLKEQLWEMNAEKNEKAAKAFSDELMGTMSELDEFFALAGESAQGVKAGLPQQSVGDKVEQVNEAVMQANLDSQLAQIKQDRKRKSRKKRHENRPAWRRGRLLPVLNLDATEPDSIGRHYHRHEKYSRRKRAETIRANIMPYKIFVGGDYASLFDSVAIDLASSMEANLPKNKLLMVQEAGAKQISPPAAVKEASQANSESPILKPMAASIPLAINPVRSALLAEGGASDDIEDITEEDVADELVNLGDDRNVLEEEERRVAQMTKSMANKELVIPEPAAEDIPEILKAPPPAAAGILAIPAAPGAAIGVFHKTNPRGDNINEEKRRSKEKDHIFKNFIVFIVAVVGIIIIFAVLVIMSMKRRPSREDLQFFQKAREIQMWEHEHLTAQRRNVYQNYDGVTPPLSPFDLYKQPNYLGGELPIGNREQLRPKPTPEVIHSNYSPAMNMDTPLLGGRHVVTEFDEDPRPNSFVSQRSRSPTWPYHFPRSYLPPTASARRGASLNYFGSDLNNSNNSILFIASQGNMAPVWELCTESAYLNDQSEQNYPKLQKDEDSLIAPTKSNSRKKRSHRRKKPPGRVLLGSGDGYFEDVTGHLWSLDLNEIRESSRGLANHPLQSQDHNLRRHRPRGKLAEKSVENKDNLNKYNSHEDRNQQNREKRFKHSLTNHHQYHRRNNSNESYNKRDRNKNGLPYQTHETSINKLSGQYKGYIDHDIIPTMQLRRRRPQHGSQQHQRSVTWVDTDGKIGHNKSLNKGENHQSYFEEDVSNNWLFNLFSKTKEDPRKAEERFYGGIQSSRLAKSDDSERERQSLEMRFLRAQSPHSIFPPPAIVRPDASHAKQRVTTQKTESQLDADTIANMNVLGVSTNDTITGKRLLRNKPLPYGTFKTVSVLLDSPNMAENVEDVSVYLTAHDMPPLATRLQPFVPYDTPVAHLTSPHSQVDAAEDMRLPPVQFRAQPDIVKGPLPKPFHHPGVAWPLAFSNKPPYACPGHEACGVKQPVGVLQTGVVPARPLKGRAWELETEIPAWISPLYKTYGIAGPYGPNGPFAKPSLMQSDARWNEIIRQADAIGALDMPGVVMEGGQLDLNGLCGAYVQLKKEHEEMLARQKQWTCKPCKAIKKFVRKVKKKLGMKVEEDPEEDKKKADLTEAAGEAKRKSGEVPKRPSGAVSGKPSGAEGDRATAGEEVGQEEAAAAAPPPEEPAA